MIEESTYYRVICDGCGDDDGSEYSAWGDHGQALDQWAYSGCQTEGDKHWCEDCRKPQCGECEKFAPVDDGNMCADCTDTLPWQEVTP